MTRETKIGLFVGMLFIAAFGLVLSGIMPKQGGPSAFPPESGGAPGRLVTVSPSGIEEPRDPSASVGELSFDVAGRGGAMDVPGSVESRMVEPAAVVAVAPVPADPAPRMAPTRAAAFVTPNEIQTKTYVLTYEPIDETLKAELEKASRGPLANDTPNSRSLAVDLPVTPPVVTPVADPVVPAGWRKYTVQSGDTLYGIARLCYGPAYGAQHSRILDVNKSVIVNANNLKIGTVLMIPPLEATAPATPASPTPARPAQPTVLPNMGPAAGIAQGPPAASGTPAIELKATVTPTPKKTYVVQKGDTLYAIARKNDMKVDDLIKLNGIKDANSLRIGQKLVLEG